MPDILLAESSAVDAENIARMLEAEGHRVYWADNGRDAIEALLEECIEVIVMEENLPSIDGLTFLELTREDLFLRQPVIVLTADGRLTANPRTAELGLFATRPKANLTDAWLLERIETAAAEFLRDCADRLTDDAV